MADPIYERFESLRESKGVSVYAVSKATEITTTTFTNWKKGKYVPKQDKLQLIADYFEVDLKFLLKGEVSEDFSDEGAHLVAKIRKDTELSKALSKYFELSDAKKKHVVELINLLSEE